MATDNPSPLLATPFGDRARAQEVIEGVDLTGRRVAAHALDPESADRLWEYGAAALRSV